jgi:flagellin-like protein
MRRLRSRSRGLSEIVGTLFLVLIVVAAATAFSIFIASYQAQLEKEQNITQLRGLENLTVLHVLPLVNKSAPRDWLALNFTVASLWIDPSILTSIRINDQPIANYSAWGVNLDTGQYESTGVAAGGTLNIVPHDEFWIQVDVSNGSSDSFYNHNFGVANASYIKFDLLTYYTNDFESTFVPPDAVAVVSQIQIFSNGNYTTLPLLDGSQSFQQGQGSILNWTWIVGGHALGSNSIHALGAKYVLTSLTPHSPANLYNVTLTVQNNEGLEGATFIQFLY